MLEFKSKFVCSNTKTEIEIKTECLNQEEKEKTLSFIAQSSHRFYLQVADKINNTIIK